MDKKNINIKVEGISKKYRLGVLGGGTLRDDIQSFWNRKIRRKSEEKIVVGNQERANEKGEFWALRDINFEVAEGEILGIVGKNGAGKSTLLKLLSQISPPTEGVIKIKGRVASLLEVGTGFHPELTGRENIFLNGAILGMKKSEINAKLNDIIEFSGIRYHIDTPVKRYSSGMKVRLGFAVAAHLEPEILIIDEVLAVGDAEFQKKCLGKMKDVASGGRTVLFVSHNMEAVQNLCTRAVLLEDGKLVRSGSSEDIVNYYMSDLVSNTFRNVHEFESKKCSYISSIKFVTDKHTPSFFSHEEINIEVSFFLAETGADVDLNISFFNKQTKLFMFFASDINNEGFGYEKPFAKGENKVSFTIPKDTFNIGDYSINLMLHKTYKEFLDVHKEEITFKVISNNNRFVKYPGISAGPINIKLNQKV